MNDFEKLKERLNADYKSYKSYVFGQSIHEVWELSDMINRVREIHTIIKDIDDTEFKELVLKNKNGKTVKDIQTDIVEPLLSYEGNLIRNVADVSRSVYSVIETKEKFIDVVVYVARCIISTYKTNIDW